VLPSDYATRPPLSCIGGRIPPKLLGFGAFYLYGHWAPVTRARAPTWTYTCTWTWTCDVVSTPLHPSLQALEGRGAGKAPQS